MTENEVRILLRKAINDLGGVRAWCRAADVRCNSHVSEFLTGKRSPSSEVLDALGLEYRIVSKCSATN